jgi:hypothetical protein
MKNQWQENLRCLLCGKTGKASLWQNNDDTPTVDFVPDGFKVVSTEYGPNLSCGTCGVPVKP